MAIYGIEKVSRLSGLSAKVLRDYDRLGLLVPLARNNKEVKRSYNEANMLTLQQIMIYKRLGMSLKKIAKKLSSNRKDSIVNLMTQRREIKNEIVKLNKMLLTIEKSLKFFKRKYCGLLRKERILMDLRETPFKCKNRFCKINRLDSLKVFMNYI